MIVRRIERVDESPITLTDNPKSGNGPILREGIVLATGPGRWIPGTWWHFSKPEPHWDWIDGWREPLEVKPGDVVLFNARWNDLAAAELKGTGADLKGPLDRPLNWRYDPMIHLIQEADIAGFLG